MSKWLISYRHTSRDIERWRENPTFEGVAIEISDVHPVVWLLAAAKRNVEPLADHLHIDRRTRVDAILSAIEIPDGSLSYKADELRDYL